MDDFRAMLQQNDFVVLDTETTGLERPAEIVQIGIVDFMGNTLLDELINPSLAIPPAATAVHGITNDMVKDAPTWPLVKPLVLEAIRGKNVVIYNAIYDRKMMHSSDDNWALGKTDYKALATFWCAMEWYAAYHGETHPYYGSFVWQKLTVACEQMGIAVSDAHSALGDAKMTHSLVRRVQAVMAAQDIAAGDAAIKGVWE